MSLIVTLELVATTVPLVLSVRTLTIKVSLPSVVESAIAVTLKLPAPPLMVKLPLVGVTSLVLLVQYSVVPPATLVVLTLKVTLLPSFTLLAPGLTLYVGTGVWLVSSIVTLELVATTVPLVLTVRILTVNDSAPSVTLSAIAVTLNDPALLFTVKLPLVGVTSVVLLLVQYSVVPLLTLVVLTLKVTLLPSFTLLAFGLTLYVGAGVWLVSLIVMLLLVATTEPLILPVRTLAVKVSVPSVSESTRTVVLNVPVLLLIVKLPLLGLVSLALLLVQYRVVPLATLVVFTVKVTAMPSLTVVGEPLTL